MACTGQNSYRYYSFSQFDEVSAILLFRDYGFSLEEIQKIMEQNDLSGVEQRMNMMLSIISEQKQKLQQQEANIRYTCTQAAQAREHLGKPFTEYHAPQRVNFDSVTLSPEHSFIINYLTDGLRNGTFSPETVSAFMKWVFQKKNLSKKSRTPQNRKVSQRP